MNRKIIGATAATAALRKKSDVAASFDRSERVVTLGAAQQAVVAVASSQAWVVADGQGARWRKWGDSGPEWTTDRDAALHFARRLDADAFAADDEDAWLIQPVGADVHGDLGEWKFERQGNAWSVTSPSGDGCEVRDNDPSPYAEVLRQLAQTVSGVGP